MLKSKSSSTFDKTELIFDVWEAYKKTLEMLIFLRFISAA
jgi:hypothetical protein